MESAKLKKFVSALPKGPGVYLFKDSRGTPLYIGKASNLRSRVSAYPKTEDPRLRKMVELTKRLDHIPTGSDIEALILESQLIKRHRPRFNIVMRDDKQYFYAGLTKEKFPRIFLTHQPTRASRSPKPLTAQSSQLKADFIGPFTDGAALKTTLRFLRRLFPYCTCKQKHHVRCLNAHIGKCPGFCCLKNNQQLTTDDIRQYRQNIRAIRDILNGKRTSLLRRFEKEMDGLARQGKLEQAIELRGKIERIRRVFENAAIIRHSPFVIRHSDKAVVALSNFFGLERPPRRMEGYDVSNVQGAHPTGSMVVFTDGQPDKDNYRKFNIKGVTSANDVAMLKEVIARRLNHPEWPLPNLIIVDGGIPQLNAFLSALKAKSSQLKAIPIIALTKNDRHRGDHIYVGNRQPTTDNKQPIPLKRLPEAVKNLILAIDAEAHRFAVSHYRFRHRKSLNS